MNQISAPAIKGLVTKHIKAVMKSENPDLSRWYCGITNDVARRMMERKVNRFGGLHWATFQAFSKEEANSVEAYFAEKGMANAKQSGGAVENSHFVYVFKLPTPSMLAASGLGGLGDFLDNILHPSL